MKKPGVGFSLFSAPCIGFSGIPSPVSGVSTTSQHSQPTPTPVTEPESRPITLVASPEQAMLPIATIEKTEKTLEQTEKTLEQPVQGPNDSLLATAQLQASAATIATPIATTAKEAVKEEIKAVEGASEGSIKFAKVCGLIAKPLRSSSFTLRLTSPRMIWLAH